MSRVPTVQNYDHVVEIRQEAQGPCTFATLSDALPPPSISVNHNHRINFRHPHYPDSSNRLITLFAPDSRAGGIEYGVAHAACGVISGNRWNGWFTTTVEGTALTFTYGDILCECDYYFHLPDSSLETPYAIVPTFKQWSFPHKNLHPCWHANRDDISLTQSIFTAPSSLSAAVYNRDQTCRMSGYEEGTQTAHLCPRSEEDWFQRNDMTLYNTNPLLVGTGPLNDTANALLLRQDLHTHFDHHKFVFVPKKIAGKGELPIVSHLLIASRELGTLYHNVRLKAIPEVHISFLFARFAWTIFTFLPGFLTAGVDRTLIGTTISTSSGLPRILTGAECKNMLLRPKSRSQSPTKRPRIQSDTVVENDADERGTQYKQEGQDVETVNIESLRHTWIERERLRSDKDKTWEKEAMWAHDIRMDDKVMDRADATRLYQFYGHEVRDCDSD